MFFGPREVVISRGIRETKSSSKGILTRKSRTEKPLDKYHTLQNRYGRVDLYHKSLLKQCIEFGIFLKNNSSIRKIQIIQTGQYTWIGMGVEATSSMTGTARVIWDKHS